MLKYFNFDSRTYKHKLVQRSPDNPNQQLENIGYVWLKPHRALPICGRSQFFGERICRPQIAEDLAKSELYRVICTGAAKISELNQTVAVGHGLAKYLVRPALAQNQTHPKFSWMQ
jgi:hypothetical protein